ncbi:MAG TPA: response regulator [Blastocatellia bacterium]|nr:response regulator [Blastocatellia bacterium]
MKKSCVLIVEDNFETLALIQVILAQAGFDVVTARNAETALQLLGSLRPDAIVTDWRMPNMTGLDLIRAARRLPHFSKIPMIILTGHTQDIQEDAIAAGATAVLEKPDGTLRLRETLSRLLGERNDPAPREKKNRSGK